MKMNRITKALSLGFLVVQLAGCGSDTESQASVQPEPPPPVTPPAPNPPTPPDPVPEPPAPEPMPLEGAVVGVNTGLSQNQITLEAQVTGNGPFTYEWQQSAGPVVSIEGEGEQAITVTLPSVEASQDVAFSVTVVDSLADSRTFEHAITVKPSVAGAAHTMVAAESVTHSIHHDMNNDGVLDVVQLLDNRHIVVHYTGNESVETVDIIRDMPAKITAIHLWDADKDNDADFFMLDENSNIVALTQGEAGFALTVRGADESADSSLSQCLDGHFFAKSASLTTAGNNGVFISCSVFDEELAIVTLRDFFILQNESGFESVSLNVVRTEVTHPAFNLNGFWVDVNGDGNTDFVPSFHLNVNAGEALPAYIGDGAGGLISQEIMPAFVNENGRVLISDIVDMNNDGRLDFVVDEIVEEGDFGVQSRNALVKLAQEDGGFQDVTFVDNDFTRWSTSGAFDYNQDGAIDVAGCSENRCAIYLNVGGEYQESFELRFQSSSGLGAFELLSVDTSAQNEQTNLYYMAGQDLFVASLATGSNNVATTTLQGGNQVPLHQRQPEFAHCDFAGQLGVCVDELSVRLLSNDGAQWQGNAISNRGFSELEALSFNDLDGDAENDVHYLSSGADPSFPSFFESHQAYLSATDYASTSLPFIDILPNRFALLNIDDDAAKEMLVVNRGRNQDFVRFYDDITAGGAPVNVPMLFDDGTGEAPVVFGGELTGTQYEGELMVFMVGGADGSSPTPDIQLRMFRLDDSGASMKLQQEQRINLQTPTAERFRFIQTDTLVPVIDVKDLQGNGNLDVVYHHAFDNSLTIYAFSFIDGRLGEQRSIWSETCEATDEHGDNLDIDVRYADIDMDGDLDILSACGNTNVYLQTHDTQFQLFQTLDKSIIDASDVDGDSDLDFIYVNKDLGYFENMIQ